MSPTGTSEHRFIPSGDVLVSGDFVRVRRKIFGLLAVTRVVMRLNTTHVYDGPTVCVKAPEGYEYDGATVPRIFWFVFERYGIYVRACLPHDILYDRRIGSKVVADGIMLEIMAAEGVPWYTRYPMFLAVLLWPPNIYYWCRAPKKRGTGYVHQRKASE